jgi:ABC-2 type transport system permease protein
LINLIKNELTKIFGKKSIYIILIICFGFVILTNFIYKSYKTEMNISGNEEYINKLIEEQKTINLKNSKNIEWYVSNQTEIDIYNLQNKYGVDSWQAYLVSEELYETVYQINYLKYGKYKNSYELKKLQKTYNKVIAKFDTDDWRSFVNDEIKALNKTLKSEKKDLTKAKGSVAKEEAKKAIFLTELDIEIANLRLSENISYGNFDYLNVALSEYQSSKISWYENKDKDRDYNEELEFKNTLKTMAVSKYKIDNKYNDETKGDMRTIYMNFFSEYQFFILIIIIFSCGAIVSDEFNKGTIKSLLIRPFSRNKILLNKFITCILMVILAIGSIFIMQSIVGYLIYGADSLKIPVVNYDFVTNKVVAQNVFSYMALLLATKAPMFIIIATLAFMLSTLIGNTAASIAISFVGSIISSIINMLVINYKVAFMRYFVTLNWDFSDYLFGGVSQFKYTNFNFSLIICLIYFIVMVLASFIIFKKKNIKNI